MFIAKSPPKPHSVGLPCLWELEHHVRTPVKRGKLHIALLRSARWRVSSAINIALLRSEEVTFARASKACWTFLERLVDFFGTAEFVGELAFGVGQVEVSDCFRNCEESMDVIRSRKHLLRDFPGRCPSFRH